MATTDLDDLRSHLEGEDVRLSKQLAELEVQSDLATWFESGVDVATMGSAAVEREAAQAQAEQLRARLAETRSAMQRLAAGTYGHRQQCGAEIVPARFESPSLHRPVPALRSADRSDRLT